MLAAYLRSLAQPQERAARRALAEPDRPPAVPLNVAGMVHGATAEQRRQPPAPPVEVRASSPPAAVPEQVAPAVKLAQPTTPKGSARLSLADAGTALGLPLDSLPKSAGVVEAFRSAGLRLSSSDGIRLELDSADVERLASDPAAVDALLLRLTRAVPSLNHVGGGAIAFR